MGLEEEVLRGDGYGGCTIGMGIELGRKGGFSIIFSSIAVLDGLCSRSNGGLLARKLDGYLSVLSISCDVFSVANLS